MTQVVIETLDVEITLRVSGDDEVSLEKKDREGAVKEGHSEAGGGLQQQIKTVCKIKGIP